MLRIKKEAECFPYLLLNINVHTLNNVDQCRFRKVVIISYISVGPVDRSYIDMYIIVYILVSFL